jgi:serine/threonine protein kinase
VLAAGARVAQYLIEGSLGAGGMGEVFAAFDERLERRVALKFLPAERELDLVARGRMLREARAASALKHPGIVTIYEIGEAEGRAFIAMELCEGETLAQRAARRGPLPPAEAVALVRQIGDALTVAHEAGILHRDVKTANLMIDARGHVKVLDFGLSKRLPGGGTPSSPPGNAAPAPELPPTETDHAGRSVDPSAPTALPESFPPLPPSGSTPRVLPSSEPVTVHGARMGTPGSAAIELMRGEEADRRSDVFSLGVVLYELLCAQRPFRGNDLRALIDAVANERYAKASTVNPAVSPRLDAVIEKALHAPREQRFASIAEMVVAAEAAAGVSAAGARRSPAKVAAIVGTALVLGGVAMAWTFGTRRVGPGGPSARAASAVPVPPSFAPGRPAPGAPRPLTAQGGCSYSPAFADASTVVYDLTDRAGANHLWSVPVAGGAPRQLTSGELTEWRAAAGRRPGEVVYLVTNPASNKGEGAGVASLDLASGKHELLSSQVASSAGFVGDVLHYVRRDGAELRRVRDGVDEAATTFANGLTAKLMTVAHDGAHVAFTAVVSGSTSVCLLAPGNDPPRCLKTPERVTNSRLAFSADDGTVYYASRDGIGRVHLDDQGNEILVPDAEPLGGVAVAPDGAHLVFSRCDARGALLDTGVTPALTLSPTGSVSQPAAAPDGRVAYVLAGSGYALMLREPDGRTRQIAGPFAAKLTQPRFSRDGRQLAFFVAGMGLMVLPVDDNQTLSPTPIVNGEADEDPAWLPDGRLMFTRRTGPGLGANVIDPRGGEPHPLAKIPRRVVGTLASGRVLLLSIDATQFIEWDVRRQKEQPSSFSPAALGRVMAVALAPSGRWLAIQSGNNTQRVYRVDLAAAHPEATLAFEAGKDQTVSAVAITDEGHVLAAPLTWAGELYTIDAAPGTRF